MNSKLKLFGAFGRCVFSRMSSLGNSSVFSSSRGLSSSIRNDFLLNFGSNIGKGVNIHELIFGTRWAVFTKIESQQGPKERTFLTGLREEVVVESGWNPPNFGRDSLFNSLLGFLPAHPSKAGGRLEFGVRNLFGRSVLAF
jgi:hypothetical protein